MEDSNSKLYARPKLIRNLNSVNAWQEIVPLLPIYKPVDLGFGYPDFMSYQEAKEICAETSQSGNEIYQYSHYSGHHRLVRVLAKYFSRLLEREVDPFGDILVTPGGDLAISILLNALISDEDEIIFLEPFYTTYKTITMVREAKIVYVPLKPKPGANDKGYTTSADWVWDDAQLEAAFNPKTKAIVICTPSNPLGKVMSPAELEKIASLCIKYNVVCISDEVYHQMVYDENLKHTSIATLSGMWERTIIVGSAGKLLSLTGFKIGWLVGDKKLINLCNQVNFSSNATFTQEATARCLEMELDRIDTPECYFNRIKQEAIPKRDFLAKQLLDIGLEPVIPAGGYFILANITTLTKKINLNDDSNLPENVKFIKFLVKKGLVCFPSTSFFSAENTEFNGNYLRICFFKKDETLQIAVEVLKSLKS